MLILNILILILIFILAVPLCLLLIVFVDAMIRLIRRSPRRIYRNRAAEADFCPLNRIPDRLIRMTLLSEDVNFRRHHGVSLEYIRDAIRINRKVKRVVTGGSTITQQLVKNLYLGFQRTIYRKLVEVILAFATECIFSKNEILELYLNVIYFGCGNYGISAASAYYFDKTPENLTLNQMFMLIRGLNAPTTNNPLRHPENYVISRNRRVKDWLSPNKKGLTPTEAELILSYPVERIDPELRKPTDELTRYSVVPMLNERFGPHWQLHL